MRNDKSHRKFHRAAVKTVFTLIAISLLASCGKRQVHNFSGIAIGTYYSVTYVGQEDISLPVAADSIIAAINREFSIFDSTSTVSRLNANATTVLTDDIIHLISLSNHISEETGGAFDITIGPLVNAMGFGKSTDFDTLSYQKQMDSLRHFIGYQKISVADGKLQKADSRIQLDFNAIEKGYAVDKIARMMKEKGYENFLVDIGGEVLAQGRKFKGQEWRVGVQITTETQNGQIETNYIFELPLESGMNCVATSGNYRNYKEINGKRYSHIINPTTGYSEKSSLLSVSVIAKDCATADAFATAFMVLGTETSMAILRNHNELAAHFIYYQNGNFQYKQTSNFPKNIQ